MATRYGAEDNVFFLSSSSVYDGLLPGLVGV